MTRSQTEDEARAELRARQGIGARYDTDGAPHECLLLARRGTAYFARKLNDLSDADLDGPSRIPNRTRRHVIAQVSYHARALSRLMVWARTGERQEMYPSAEARDAEIELGATLPPRALRSLFQHAEIHLNVEWRDLGDKAWDCKIQLLDKTWITASQTPFLRAQVVWSGAFDLNNGARFRDLPDAVRHSA